MLIFILVLIIVVFIGFRLFRKGEKMLDPNRDATALKMKQEAIEKFVKYHANRDD